ncbi:MULTISPECIES: phospho-N-acetylmuramoyl-pentapeptide-transferase [unclassified Thermotoga]|uniref:phospho-N-acetylmuramoyl-pentapeptide- transferase n=1 Tax=unclassified Thermotoga TaxID=2631113 RepID=UPI000542A30B|nr:MULTISPECIES: phospho-N-acetylmuramoyl-pentapeptide-transferase [unclassified Thermotoga]KAF2959411.1 phospho-N-acetylmuramoyl-pentapeptide-transferase [Thermotoga sp. 38H-to]KHC93293.1 phospho-N-acetylmuramoyl-pentapeptide-transferase [Thermotoga sp. Mc24]
MIAANFLLNLVLYPILIKLFRHRRIGQYIRKEGPDLHGYKEGTPTMGGILFVLTSFLFGMISKTNTIVLLGMFLFFLIGFLDDFLSVARKDSTGLKTYQKALLQTLVAFIMLLLIRPETNVDFFGSAIEMGKWYYLFALLVIVGSSNATNLTDGLDGLAGWIYVSGSIPYWFFLKERGISEDTLLILVAGVLAFLVFNSKPAKIFMGDTGSITLGGVLGTVSVLTKTEFYLVLFFLIPVVETLSVILQVGSFKIFKRRIFRMSPLHHHFELLGWSEEKIVAVFTVFNLMSSLVALEVFGVIG